MADMNTVRSLEDLTLSIVLCLTSLDNLAKDNTWHYFLVDLILLCSDQSVRMSTAKHLLLFCISTLLTKQVETLDGIKVDVVKAGTTGVNNTTFEEHLAITRELGLFLPLERKLEIGSSRNSGLIKELVED